MRIETRKWVTNVCFAKRQRRPSMSRGTPKKAKGKRRQWRRESVQLVPSTTYSLRDKGQAGGGVKKRSH